MSEPQGSPSDMTAVAEELRDFYDRYPYPRPVESLNKYCVCPCCGSLPVASIVRTEGPVTGLRYLHCSLCDTEWNLVRVKCAACDSTRGIAYDRIDGRHDPISAETCDSCNSYLKIAYAAQHAEVDPVADDLATLSLDFLVDEAGYQRAGPNLLLFPGKAD